MISSIPARTSIIRCYFVSQVILTLEILNTLFCHGLPLDDDPLLGVCTLHFSESADFAPFAGFVVYVVISDAIVQIQKLDRQVCKLG